jgi:superfamily II DNA or RNA helicase
MLLRITDSWTWVEQASDAELEWVGSFLSFEDVRAKYRQQNFGKKPDDRVRLLQRRADRPAFPTGLVPVLKAGAARRGFRVDELDKRAGMPASTLATLQQEPWNMTGTYAHQHDAISAWLAGGPGLVTHPLPGRGIVWAPTASGKGRIACGIAAAIEGKWLFAVHRGHLVEDVRERWETLTGETAGMIGDGRWDVGDRLTCATLQTLYAQRKEDRFARLADEVTGLIIDEAHTAPAATFYATIQRFTSARLRVGLSGTPLDRHDKRSMVAIGAIGPVVYRIKATTLQERGVLAVPTVRVIPVWQSAEVWEWAKVYDQLIVGSTHRNGAIIASMLRARDEGELPGMVFVRSLHHGRSLARMAAAKGLNVRFVSGDANLGQRKSACSQLSSGRLDFVIATKVFTEGVNVPDLRTVINAQGGKSVIDTLQQIGRGMRVTETKKAVTVYEFGDKGHSILHRHAKQRLAACQREGYRCVVDRTLWPERV